MKNKILKIFIYVSYPLLVFGLIVLATLLFLENKKYNELSATFENARTTLNKEKEDKQITIDDLSSEFNDLTSQINSLKEQNSNLSSQIEDMKVEGQATITGRILPFISADSASLSQYQRVCAESTENTSIQICKTVSVLQQGYQLIVPAGTYRVYAEIFPTPKPESSYFGKKAYYTEFVKCVNDQGVEKCAQAKKTPVSVVVKVGDIASGVNPIGWN